MADAYHDADPHPRPYRFSETERDEVARILEIVARDGLPEPRDLDVALDAIEAALES